MDSDREGVIPLDDKELKKFAKFININGKYRFFNDDKDLIKIYQEQIDQLTNNWNELEEWIKQNSWYYNTSDGCQWIDQFKLLDKMEEIKEGNNDKD